MMMLLLFVLIVEVTQLILYIFTDEFEQDKGDLFMDFDSDAVIILFTL